MCNSLAQGGRRCASSLEPAFTRAMKAYHDSGDDLSSQMTHDLLPPARAYASTPAGRRVISELIQKETLAQMAGDYADFDFTATDSASPEELLLNSIFGGNNNYYLAKEYFAKNLPFNALLETALMEGDRISLDYNAREQDIYELARQKRNALKEASLLPSDPNEKMAYHALEVAIKNGGNIAAPAGSVVFTLDYSQADYDGANNDFLGVYQSVDDAKRAAVAKVLELIDIEDWGSDLDKADSPWGALTDMNLAEWNRRKIEWFKSHSDDEILEWAATDMPSQMKGFGGTFSATTFDIYPTKVESIPDTYPEEIHLTD